jgi:hypothetical protein
MSGARIHLSSEPVVEGDVNKALDAHAVLMAALKQLIDSCSRPPRHVDGHRQRYGMVAAAS